MLRLIALLFVTSVLLGSIGLNGVANITSFINQVLFELTIFCFFFLSLCVLFGVKSRKEMKVLV